MRELKKTHKRMAVSVSLDIKAVKKFVAISKKTGLTRSGLINDFFIKWVKKNS